MNRFVRISVLLVAILLVSMWPAAAQENDAETYNVIAGMSSSDVEVAAFGPARLQVHRGDTVRWLWAGFHNVHFNNELTMFLIPYEQDGLQELQVNPEVAFPTIESGGTYTGGMVNSGLPLGGPGQSQSYFELTIDAEPGVYMYFCDVHPGMVGTIEVVGDDVEILMPSEALSAGFEELYSLLESGFPLVEQASINAENHMHEGGANIMIGAGAGLIVNFDFYPNVVVIRPGQSVTWTMSPDIMALPIGISSAPGLPFEEMMRFVPPSDGGMPSVVFSDLYVNGQVGSGSEIGLSDSWLSGILDAGESYTLTFREPGVYRFTDTGPGKQGAVVVLP